MFTILGLLAPFLPQFLALFQTYQDHKHELAMATLSMKAQAETGALNLEGQLTAADVADVASARQAQPSYGIQLLDAIKAEKTPGFLMRGIAGFVIFALGLVEIANGFIRPGVTYYLLALYGAAKGARFYLYLSGAGTHDPVALAQAMTAIWDTGDLDLLGGVIAFWFASRHLTKDLGPLPKS